MANNTLKARLIQRNDSAENWQKNNPVLLKGEMAVETNGDGTKVKVKYGDGKTAYNDLPYFGGGGSAEEVTYNNADYPNVQEALDAINDKINYVPIAINSVSNNVNTVEKGTKIRAVDVSWSFNNAVLQGATLNGTALTADELKANKKSFTYPAPAEGSTAADPALVKDTTFTLVATDTHKATATKSTGIYFKNQKYWGAGKPASINDITNDFIKALTGKAFADNAQGTFNVNATDDNYIFYAFPHAWGTPKFVVGGIEGGFALVKTFDFTNASGYTESYDVYQSGNANLGDTTVTVQ